MNLPKWVRPKEVLTIKYWLHLAIIAVIVYILINQFIQPMPITAKAVFEGTLLTGAADIIAHSILQLD